MPTVLLTGNRGFTGRHLVPLLLARGYDVVGLEQHGAKDADIPQVACDLTDPEAIRRTVADIRPTHVVHLAGLAFVGHSGSTANEEMAFYRVNLFGTQNLLAALADLPRRPEKVVVASSANVYGAPADVEVLDESMTPMPVNHYAASKLAMEHMARTWFGQLPIVLARPFNYTGPGQDEKFVIPKIAAHFRRGERRIELGNLDVSRDFSDVRDVARCYADLLACGARSCTLNICRGEATSLGEVLAAMERIAGRAIEVAVNPAFVRQNEIPRLLGSNRRLREAIGFAPEIPLEDTLKSLYDQP